MVRRDSFETFSSYLFIVLALGLLILSLLPFSVYAYFAGEDGLVENATVLFCFLGAYLSFKAFFMRKNILSRKDLVLLFIGALFLFVGLEEISWGQRVIGFRPILVGNEINYQREFSFHNIGALDFFVYVGGFLFIVMFAGVLPILTYASFRIRRLCIKYGVPLMPKIICLSLWLGFITFVLIPQITYWQGHLFSLRPVRYIFAILELRELYFAFVLFSYIAVEYFYLLKYGKSYEF